MELSNGSLFSWPPDGVLDESQKKPCLISVETPFPGKENVFSQLFNTILG
jgi:hypothetical protein